MAIEHEVAPEQLYTGLGILARIIARRVCNHDELTDIDDAHGDKCGETRGDNVTLDDERERCDRRSIPSIR